MSIGAAYGGKVDGRSANSDDGTWDWKSGQHAAGLCEVTVRRACNGGSRRSRSENERLSLSSVNWMGKMARRWWSGSVGVVRKQPEMRHRASFWATRAILTRHLICAPVAHRGEPYVRTGRTMAWKTLHQFAKSRP